MRTSGIITRTPAAARPSGVTSFPLMEPTGGRIRTTTKRPREFRCAVNPVPVSSRLSASSGSLLPATPEDSALCSSSNEKITSTFACRAKSMSAPSADCAATSKSTGSAVALAEARAADPSSTRQMKAENRRLGGGGSLINRESHQWSAALLNLALPSVSCATRTLYIV